MSEPRYWDYRLDTGEMTPAIFEPHYRFGEAFDVAPVMAMWTSATFYRVATFIRTNHSEHKIHVDFSRALWYSTVDLVPRIPGADVVEVDHTVYARPSRSAWLAYPYWGGVIGIAALAAVAPKEVAKVRFDWLGHPYWAGISAVATIIAMGLAVPALVIAYLAYKRPPPGGPGGSGTS